MNVTCVSSCPEYTLRETGLSMLTILPSDYECGRSNLGSVSLLPVEMILVSGNVMTIYTITLYGDPGLTDVLIQFSVSVNAIGPADINGQATYTSPLVTGLVSSFNLYNNLITSSDCSYGNTSMTFKFTYASQTYIYKLVLDPRGSYSNVSFSLQTSVVSLSSPVNTSTSCRCQKSNTCNACHGLINPECNNVRVPNVFFTAQTTIDGTDVGEADFTICDEYTYYNTNPLPPMDRCAVNYICSNQLKQTKFRQCCPFMVSVVKGDGTTLMDKVFNIYDKFQIQIGFWNFYNNIVLYGMLKYVLSRILYGDFNIDYLLGKYDEKFLIDLGNSRFCEAITVFEDCTSAIYGYSKYFKYNNI